MSWSLFLDMIRSEAGDDLAARIEKRCRRELQGVRSTIAKGGDRRSDQATAGDSLMSRKAAADAGTCLVNVSLAGRQARSRLTWTGSSLLGTGQR